MNSNNISMEQNGKTKHRVRFLLAPLCVGRKKHPQQGAIMKKTITRYALNRSWGDGRCEALFHAMRGKAFPYFLTQQIITSAGENMLSAEESAEIIKKIMGETNEG